MAPQWSLVMAQSPHGFHEIHSLSSIPLVNMRSTL